MSSRRRTPKARQQSLPFKSHGGARKGAGRKPNGDQAGVAHRSREALASRHPAHITCKLHKGLPSMRQRAEYAALRAAFAAGCERFGFRLTHYAILRDHLHFVVEAKDRVAMRRGISGLLIRIARALNRLWQRKGSVFADRYHDRVLKTPSEVRNVLRYVFGNAKKHGAHVPQAVDTFTSAVWFDGFRETLEVRGLDAIVRPIAAAHTWLLRVGWRRLGLLSVTESPAVCADEWRR